MNCSAPYVEDVVAGARGLGRRPLPRASRCIPQYSLTTTKGALERSRAAVASSAPGASFHETGSWPTHPLFVQAHAESIREELARFEDPRPEAVHLLFSAHSIPKKLVTREGDPYASEVEAGVRAIVARLSWNGPWSLAYQSKLGPVEWLGPPTLEVIRELGRSGQRQVLAVPIAFVTDHVETLYEMDQLFGEEARAAGIARFLRTPGLNSRPTFLQALADIARSADGVLERLMPATATVVVGGGLSGLTAATKRVARRGRDRSPRARGPRGRRRADRAARRVPPRDRAQHRAPDARAFWGSPRSSASTPEMLVSDPRLPRFVDFAGRLHALPASPGALVSTRLLSTSGKLRLLAEPLRRRGDSPDESVRDFFARRLGPEVADRIVTPFVGGIFAGDATRLSVAEAFPSLARWERLHGSIVLGAHPREPRPPGREGRAPRERPPLVPRRPRDASPGHGAVSRRGVPAADRRRGPRPAAGGLASDDGDGRARCLRGHPGGAGGRVGRSGAPVCARGRRRPRRRTASPARRPSPRLADHGSRPPVPRVRPPRRAGRLEAHPRRRLELEPLSRPRARRSGALHHLPRRSARSDGSRSLGRPARLGCRPATSKPRVSPGGSPGSFSSRAGRAPSRSTNAATAPESKPWLAPRRGTRDSGSSGTIAEASPSATWSPPRSPSDL